ncbi:hypothetical protein J3L16_13390 [Alteromonas sp. 5E99-2]|uniref:hypothetical protein n=1 Tax=Alteromonas sp. 5E99-2 TaxID=2817683 RepID=UPI001A98F933|nr:hypothetical protein [Alteromonas sp. 5E99-2]MBO1256680.1 hypothetical protein [Alteromonas sp. 5E99-2]
MMHRMWLPLLLFVFLCGISRSTFGVPNQQLSFNRVEKGQSIKYDYRWYDHNNKLRHITFEIDKQAIAKLPRNQANYKPALIQSKIRRDLTRLAKGVDPRKARINLQQIGNDLDVSIRSDNPQLINLLHTEFQNQKQLTYDLYLKQHYFEKFTSSSGANGVKADHIRYIQEFTPVFKEIAEQFYELLGDEKSVRNYIDLLLSWAQSIPYSTLTGRGESNGAGFLPPIRLLDANMGDCDSKSVLFAALLRNYLPQAKFQFIILPKHALLGIKTSEQPSDFTVENNGARLVIMEPTGPAPFGFGEAAESSKTMIQRGLATFQVIP